jgi:hypothetical protein
VLVFDYDARIDYDQLLNQTLDEIMMMNQVTNNYSSYHLLV